MASFDDVSVAPGSWVNVTSATGAAVGASLIIQNLSGLTVMVEESVASPASNSVGFRMGAYGEKDSTVVTSPGGAESVWAKVVGNATVTLHVELS